ncbi:hypothetical protein AJ78_03455 [Emergomyces pasteurianus Ep9510]|uniref:Major facilitator superfamily (MFS) profile domain-containing protein n=1 Tax=Emergomyces pasteurianus Ep9510 TaxID=1447872 RepID=A0A1J9QKD8_9EURO|nr:hypothetical protein AJ78_03455 [Emergomyces pasteurianus Ep9510]
MAPTVKTEKDARDGDATSIKSDPESLQAGVQKAMVLKKAWSKNTLIIAFAGLIISTLVLNLSDYSTIVYEPYATSEFRQHSMMSVARVVGNITRTCAYPVVAKLCDVFGRAEMFIFSIVVQTLALVLYATSRYIDQYAAAGIFDAIGATAFLLTQQVFIADATNLVNRGLWSSIPETVSTLPAIYLGTIIGDNVLKHSTWRWGWGMWAIVFPVCSIPLITTMLVLQKRAAKHGLAQKPRSLFAGYRAGDPVWKKVLHLIWTELDLPGALLLIASFSLVLIPLSLTGSFNSQRWGEPSFIVMLVLGVVLFIAFVVWDSKFAKKPFIPYRMVVERTVIAACLASALDFGSYVLFTLFFPSYLQVAGGYSPGHATRIDNALRVSNQVFSLFIGLGMKYTKRSQMWIFMGPPVTVLSQGIMIYLVNMGYGRNTNEAAFVTAKVLNGFGRACLQTAGQVSVQAVVSTQDVAVATAVYQAVISMGGAVGVSISGAIWRNHLPNQLRRYLPADAQKNATAIFQSIVVAKSSAPGSPIREAVNQSYRESQRMLAIASTCMAAPILILMFFMKNVHLDEMDEEAKEKERQNKIGEETPEEREVAPAEEKREN